jgi:PhnB protein
MQSFKEAGFPHAEKDDDLIIHANLTAGKINIMASDGNEDHPVRMGDNVHLSIVGTNVAKLEEWFHKLSEGGKIDMKLEKQFWGDVYGQLTDKFGVHWMINIGTVK